MANTPKARAEMSRRELRDAFHQGLLQKERLLQLATPLGADVLVPLRAQGWAKIGRDYRWTVDVVSIRVDIPLLSLMHQPVTLRIQQTGSPFGTSAYRQIHGFVHRMSMLGTDGDLTAYQIEFSSALYFLGHTRNDRYWLDTNASDILYEVLTRYPQLHGCVRVNISSTPRARPYCRQAESDLNFVHRLLEDEGWYYYWQQAEDRTDGSHKTTLVIVDRLWFLPKPEPVSYRRGKSGDETADLTQWTAVQTLQSTAYTACSFDYRYPWDNSKVTSKLWSTSYVVQHSRSDETVYIPTVPMEVFESLSYGYPDSQAGDDRARLRTQAWDARANRYTGTGGLRWIDAGSLRAEPASAARRTRHPAARVCRDRDALDHREQCADWATRR
jgi:type VI secretion system secreted protein VgrG